MKSIKKIMLLTLLIAAIAVAATYTDQSRAATDTATASTGTSTQVMHVTQGDLSATLSVVGQLDAEQNSSLAFEHMSGTANLLTLAIQAGNVVTTRPGVGDH